MKHLFSISSSSFHRLQKQLLVRIAATRARISTTGSGHDSLYSRISPLGDPNNSVVPVLDKWVREGKTTYRGDLRRLITQLTTYRRFKHALEVSLWMTNKQQFTADPFDVAVRLKLMFKVFGLDQVENYLNKIPEDSKTYHVYLALLNCYALAKNVDKAESTMQKARDLGYASKPIWYNLLMNLHYQVGNREKVGELLNEMKAKGIDYDEFTLSVCLSVCAMNSDVRGMDKIMIMMESNRRRKVHWRTYVTAAEGYLRMGLIDKALAILKTIEVQLTASKRWHVLFVVLMRLYTDAGKKDELYRIWNLCKQSGKIQNKVYISMMRSLVKFGDVEGAEKLLEEWESTGFSYDFRVPNFLIDAYCTDGQLEKAEAVITKGMSKGGEPPVTTWCHLAGGYLSKMQVNKAIETLKKAISVCAPRFMSQKDSLTNCLKYLESGDCMDKAEELIKSVRNRGIREAVSDDLYGSGKDGGLQSCGQDQNSDGVFVIQDEFINEKEDSDKRWCERDGLI